MCGIAGVMMRDGRAPDPAILDRLTNALAHRGPDGNGRYISAPVGLAHTRLAIVDLKTGDQPLFEGGGAVLVANGEIYNDPELRDQLRDVAFATCSDCEVPLHLYRRDGTVFAAALRGMYAIAIYDPASTRLTLARDPFGIKPLYYVERADGFAFASEPQALLAAGLAKRSLRSHARAELLQLKFTTGASTIFPEIQRVLPGETVLVADGRIIERRCRQPLSQGASPAANYDDALRQLDKVLSDTVEHHLRADVPYGLFLSGGIDSSTLAGLMARMSSQPVVAFTAGFPGSAAADESSDARRVAQAIGADHHVVEVTERDFWNQAPAVAAALDDPTTDAATLPTYLLAKAAKDHVKVVLTGEGGDEIFCGYGRYYRARRFWGLFARKARSRGEFDGLGHLSEIFNGWRDGLSSAEHEQARDDRTFMQKLQAVDCAEWLPNDLLIKVDRCLMAHGLEGRTPFLDPVVADFAFRLPDDMKATTKMAKRMLRDWLAINVPAAEPYAKKLGFNPPVGEWIAARRPLIEKLVACQPGIREMFRKDHVAQEVARAFSDLKRHHQAAWSLLFYALWHSHHVLEIPPDGTIEDVLAHAAASG
jgi:asparagine synthase (glutamine-hydrolysing)